MDDQTIIARLEKEVDVVDRHLEIFTHVWQAEPIGIVELSNQTNLPHHRVRYSLRILEEEDLIEPGPTGVTTAEHAQEFVDSLNDDLTAVIGELSDMKLPERKPLESA